MNIVAALSSFTYKVKALFKVNKKPTARVYEHVPKFGSPSSKNAPKSPSKQSPKKSPSTSRKGKKYGTYFNNIIDSLVKFVSGASDSEQEGVAKPTKTRIDSAGTSPTAQKVDKQSSYDIEATGEDELDSKEDTKLLQEEEADDGEVFNDETKGTTSSLQAGWNISNLIQGKFVRLES